jgi:hypothetical protein
MAGIRLWICPTKSFEGTVMIANVRSHWPVFGFFQFSHKPARPKNGAVLHGYGKGLLRSRTSDRFPLEKSVDWHNAATKRASLSELGKRETLSALALIGLRPPFESLHQWGIRAHLIGSSDHSPVFRFCWMTSSSWLGAAL